MILDLIERVLNAIVGGQVKIFRTKKLSRANDVTFRTNLKVKCEHGNVWGTVTEWMSINVDYMRTVTKCNSWNMLIYVSLYYMA